MIVILVQATLLTTTAATTAVAGSWLKLPRIDHRRAGQEAERPTPPWMMIGGGARLNGFTMLDRHFPSLPGPNSGFVLTNSHRKP